MAKQTYRLYWGSPVYKVITIEEEDISGGSSMAITDTEIWDDILPVIKSSIGTSNTPDGVYKRPVETTVTDPTP